jgi:hypothetical protein
MRLIAEYILIGNNLRVETCELILSDRIDQINRKYSSREEWMGKLPIEDEYGL